LAGSFGSSTPSLAGLFSQDEFSLVAHGSSCITTVFQPTTIVFDLPTKLLRIIRKYVRPSEKKKAARGMIERLQSAAQ